MESTLADYDPHMLVVHYSNRLEKLAERLGAVISQPSGAPLRPEMIAVQNVGVARWLSLRLAEQHGIAANYQFLFPAELIWDLFTATLDDVPAQTTYDAATLTWRLLRLLDSRGHDATLGPVRAYLSDGDGMKRYGLAQRLARVFEQYLVFRPDWIEGWEAGQGEDWQAHLWRALVAQGDPRHWVRLQKTFLAAATADQLRTECLPARIALFGVATLSPAYLDVLDRLALRIDVHVFVLNPCEQYWGDIVTEKDRERRAEQEPAAAAYLETGNSLLASLGKQGRDFIDLLQGLGPQETDAFAAPGEDCLLHRIQSDIFALREPDTDGGQAPIVSEDHSVQVHVCHSPMREVEVLHDRLLDLFERHPALTPSDIMVMMPDLESYAPYIEAVFATRNAEKRIRFSIADRGIRAESALVEGFFSLLELGHSRYEVNTVVGLLELPALQRRLGLTDEDLGLIHHWVRETGIRWGLDSANRAALELPATGENTWKAGMERLLLGYALPESDHALFHGILPYAAMEGAPAQTLGRLQTYLSELAAVTRQPTEQCLPVSEWVAVLHDILDRFFDADEDEVSELQCVRAALADMSDTAQRAGYDRPVDRETIAADLRQRLDRPGLKGRFLAGAVTFGALVPMRSLPFKVICLLGMNDGSFPRPHRPLSFDRTADAFRQGDRSRRQDDRYLFLETLISARQCVYISYVGRNIRDDSVIPPAVVVSELLDYIAGGYCLADDQPVRRHLVVEHPLQAFSPRYFGQDRRLFSYATALAEAGEAAARHAEPRTPLFACRLPDAEPEWRDVELEQLMRFYQNPVRYLLRERLGVHLEEGEGIMESREPFTLDAGATRRLRGQMLPRILDGEGADVVLPYVRATGMLPHGCLGEALFAAEQAAVTGFARRLAPHMSGANLSSETFDVALGGMRLFGRLSDLSSSGLVAFSVAKMTAGDWVRLWLRHLVLNLLNTAAEPITRFVSEDEDVRLAPVADAHTHLEQLVSWYWEGLHRPLHFFPRSGLAYVTATKQPMIAAQAKWQATDYSWGESQDLYFQLAFAGTDPLDDEFERLARVFFGTLFEHREDAE